MTSSSPNRTCVFSRLEDAIFAGSSRRLGTFRLASSVTAIFDSPKFKSFLESRSLAGTIPFVDGFTPSIRFFFVSLLSDNFVSGFFPGTTNLSVLRVNSPALPPSFSLSVHVVNASAISVSPANFSCGCFTFVFTLTFSFTFCLTDCCDTASPLAVSFPAPNSPCRSISFTQTFRWGTGAQSTLHTEGNIESRAFLLCCPNLTGSGSSL